MGERKTMVKLTDAQRAFLKRLYLDGGHSRLFNATYQTAVALHDKGLVSIEIIDPVTGRVSITDEGMRIAKATIALLESRDGRIDILDILAKEDARHG